MRKRASVAVFTLALVAGFSARAEDKKGAAAAFDQLKSLAGDWTMGEGKVAFTYRVVAAGSTVMETLFPGSPHEMVTMYHLDHDDLVLTHYCASGNQPRMKAKLGDPKKLVFEFAGGSNLDPARDTHMHEAAITFTDADHVTSEWTSFEAGKKKDTHTFELTRLKK